MRLVWAGSPTVERPVVGSCSLSIARYPSSLGTCRTRQDRTEWNALEAGFIQRALRVAATQVVPAGRFVVGPQLEMGGGLQLLALFTQCEASCYMRPSKGEGTKTTTLFVCQSQWPNIGNTAPHLSQRPNTGRNGPTPNRTRLEVGRLSSAMLHVTPLSTESTPTFVKATPNWVGAAVSLIEHSPGLPPQVRPKRECNEARPWSKPPQVGSAPNPHTSDSVAISPTGRDSRVAENWREKPTHSNKHRVSGA